MIRTIAFAGHSGSGKTTLGEALLYLTGAKDRRGSVSEGTTTSDYTPEEKAHGISVRTAVLPLDWKGHKFFVLDTPGYLDFIASIRGALTAADAAVVTVSAPDGVQIGTERAWTVAERLELPRMVVVTKLDKGGDFFQLLEDLRSTLGSIVPVHLPWHEGEKWVGLLDVLHNKALRYDGEKYEEVEIPAELADQVAEYHEQAIEAIVETDENLLEQYLEAGEEPAPEQVAKAFHEAVRQGLVYPVAIASGETLIGVEPLLDIFLEALPSPTERWGEGPPLAKVFKVQVEPFVGKVAYVRLYRGELKPGDTLQSENGPVKFNKLYIPRGNELIEVDKAEAGYILALPKADNLHRTMALWAEEPEEVPMTKLPEPTTFMAIVPKGKGDEAKLGEAVNKLLEEDPSLRLERNEETGEMLLWGMGDMHLEVAKERLHDYGVDVELKLPKIPYRETIRRKAEGQGKHKKQTGGHGQYGDVWLRLEPAEDYEFVWEITGGVIPTKYKEAVEKGIKEAAKKGVLAGYPVIGFRAAVYDGSHHSVDSSDLSFQIAASLAFKKVAEMAGPTLLEPIYKLKIIVPQDKMGDILSDLQSRRGRVLGSDMDGALAVINAEAPLGEILEYSRVLRSLTAGQGAYNLEFSHYAEVPPQLAQKIIEEAQSE